MKRTNLCSLFRPATFALSTVAILISSCQKTIEPSPTATDDAQVFEMKSSKSNDSRNAFIGKKVGHFQQVNLVANTTGYGAAHIDPTLVNAWGLAFAPNGNPWIGSQGGHVSNVYNPEGVPAGINPVSIPGPAPNSTSGGNPTGIVFNPSSTDFPIAGGAARFIFDGVDGVISAWRSGTSAVKVTVGQGAYTGLALAAYNGNNYLYAANFGAGRIDVWDKAWTPVTTFPFNDPNIPAGYVPFNIQNIGGNLYVAYAKVDPVTHRSEEGNGKGFVDIFSPNGMLIKRFASMGALNAPWGLTMASRSFFKNEMDDDDDHDGHGNNRTYILVGNFGNGRINVFESDGKFVGQLRSHKDPVVIDGLWAISFAPSTSPVDPNRLYFAAGPDNETHGLFGYLLANDDDDDD